ncbi:B3/B4 domain-containing protein [Dongshaea marina]|uniref:B3/B4 domain-containing protein n=1 Tax=Dongshaea marina TaxID=2047966 RepID=UPI00131F23A9|nr:phenylalanine--tRNA ligase beta subunit-related protein [Dongshaea marina]
MNLSIEPSILAQHPSLQLGVLHLQGVNNSINPSLAQSIQDEHKIIRAELEGKLIRDLPQVSVWRTIYRQFGAKPKKHLSSIENLLTRLQKSQGLSSINPLVDLYNLVSLKYRLPVGGEDLDKVTGDIELRFARLNEPEIKLLGDPVPRAPSPGEVIYADDKGAICRRWNWKEAERTKLTEQTQNALIVLEALEPTQHLLADALGELSQKFSQHCEAEISCYLMNRSTPAIKLV